MEDYDEDTPNSPATTTLGKKGLPSVNDIMRGVFSSEKRQHRTVRQPGQLRTILQDPNTFLLGPYQWQLQILRATNSMLTSRFDVARFVLLETAKNDDGAFLYTPTTADSDVSSIAAPPPDTGGLHALDGHNKLFGALLQIYDSLAPQNGNSTYSQEISSQNHAASNTSNLNNAASPAAGSAKFPGPNQLDSRVKNDEEDGLLRSETADATLELLSKLISAGTTAENVRELLQRSAHALIARNNKDQLRFLHVIDRAIRLSEADHVRHEPADQGIDVTIALALRPDDRKPYALQAFEENTQIPMDENTSNAPELGGDDANKPLNRAPSPDFAFFNFGGPRAGISIDTLNSWPFPREYCIWMWIRIEEECGRCNLVSLRNHLGHGIKIELGGDDIIGYSITCVSTDERHSGSVRVGIPPERLSSRTWHQITIHHYSRMLLGSSVLRVLVDNIEVKQANGYNFTLPFPSRVKGPISDAVLFDSFDGQAGPFYIFREGLSLTSSQGLMKSHLNRAKVGHSTAISMVGGSGLVTSAVERGLETKVYLSFDPVFVVKNLCLEVYGGRHGTLRANSSVWNMDNIRNLMGVIGGVPILLPFLWKKLSDDEHPLRNDKDENAEPLTPDMRNTTHNDATQVEDPADPSVAKSQLSSDAHSCFTGLTTESDYLTAGCCIVQIIALLARSIRQHVHNQLIFMDLQGPNLIASALELLPRKILASAASNRLLVNGGSPDDEEADQNVDFVPLEVSDAPLFAAVAALMRAAAGLPSVVFEENIAMDGAAGIPGTGQEPSTPRGPPADQTSQQQAQQAGGIQGPGSGQNQVKFKYNALEKALDLSLIFNLNIIARCAQADGSRSWTQVQWFDEAHGRVSRAPRLFKEVLGLQTWIDNLRLLYEDIFFNNILDVTLSTTKEMINFISLQWVRIAAAMLCEEVTENELHIIIAAAIGAGHGSSVRSSTNAPEPDSPFPFSVANIPLFGQMAGGLMPRSRDAHSVEGTSKKQKNEQREPQEQHPGTNSSQGQAAQPTWNIVDLYLARDAIRLLTVLLRSTPPPKRLFENCIKLDAKSGLACVLASNVVASSHIGDDLRALALRCITEFLIRVEHSVPLLEGFLAPSLHLLSQATSSTTQAFGASRSESALAGSVFAMQQVPEGVKAFADAGGYSFLVHALATILSSRSTSSFDQQDKESSQSDDTLPNSNTVPDLNATYTALLEMMIAKPLDGSEPNTPPRRLIGARHHSSMGSSLGAPRRRQSHGSATWSIGSSNVVIRRLSSSLAVDLEDNFDSVADLFVDQAELGPILDDTQVIFNPHALLVVLKLLPRLGLYLQQRICQDLFLLLKFQPINRLYFCEVPGWQGSFLGLLGSLDNEGLTTSGAQVCFDLGVKLYVLVLQDVLVERVNGWQEIETMMSLKPLLVRGEEITRSVLAQVMDGTLRELRMDMPSDPVRITVLWKSLRRIVLLVDMLTGLLPRDNPETITTIERLLDAVDLVTSVSPQSLLLDSESASRSVRLDAHAVDLFREFCWPVDPRNQDELDKLRGPVAFAIISLSLNAMLHCSLGAPSLRKHARRVTKVSSFLRRIPRMKSLVRWPTLRGSKVKGEKSALVIKALVDTFTMIRRAADAGAHEDGSVAHNLDYLLELLRSVSTTHSDLLALTCEDEFFVRKVSSLNADTQNGPEWIFASVITQSPFVSPTKENASSAATEEELAGTPSAELVVGIPAALHALEESRAGINTFMQARLRARWDEHGTSEMAYANTQGRARRESMALGFSQRLAFTESSRLGEKLMIDSERERELVELWRQLTIEAAHEDSIWQVQAAELKDEGVEWMLSSREDKYRCRRLLCRNYFFDDHLDALYHEITKDIGDENDDLDLDANASFGEDDAGSYHEIGYDHDDMSHRSKHLSGGVLEDDDDQDIAGGSDDGEDLSLEPSSPLQLPKIVRVGSPEQRFRMRTESESFSVIYSPDRDEDNLLQWWRWLGGRFVGEPDLQWFEWLGGRVVGPPRPTSWRRKRPSLYWQRGHGRRPSLLSPLDTPNTLSPLTPLGPGLMSNLAYRLHGTGAPGVAAPSPLNTSTKIGLVRQSMRSPMNLRPLSPMGSPLSPRGGAPSGFNMISTQPRTPQFPSRASSPKTPRIPTNSLLNEVHDWAVRGWDNSRREQFALRKGEQLVHVCSNAQWITPLEVTRGRLELSSEHLFFYADHPSQAQMPELDNPATRDSAWVSDLNVPDSNIPGIGVDAYSEASSKRRKRLQQLSKEMMRWSLSELTEIHGRRYLLRATALELFFSDMTNIFLCFPSAKARSDFFKAILRQPTPKLARTFKESLKPNVVFQRSGLMERWKRREISNFEYIMQINTVAGRSYNDITQYPIFPWIIADYESETLDLEDPSIYRDLSKPIGALNEIRLRDFVERFESFCDASMDIPPFHYGSHYSNAGIVLHYLLRVEPFSTLAIDLQGGRFDCPDRLFFSIHDCWLSSMESMSDVKELIPEFFYCPEMFLNSNNFNLGVRQDTKLPVDDVVLPPWAKGSAQEFVRIQREALESEYVSQHLNEWIDLIFGYKQLGEAAEEAHNVFYYLTYEGAVDLDAIVDPVLRHSIETQIAHFGQTPAQLLTQPHPARDKPSAYLALSQETILKGEAMELSRHCVWTEPANASTLMPAAASGPRSPTLAISTNNTGNVDQVAPPKSTWGSFFKSAVRVSRTTSETSTTNDIPAPKTGEPSTANSLVASMDTFPRAPPVISLTAYPGRLVAVYEDLSVFVHRVAPRTWIPRPGNGRVISSAPLSLSAWARPSDRSLLRMDTGKAMRIGSESVVCAKQGKLVVSANNLDWSLRVQNVDNYKIDGAVSAHRGRVLCVANCEKEEVLVTGGQDCRVIVWRLSGAQDIREEMIDLFVAPELSTSGALSTGGTATSTTGTTVSARPGAILTADGLRDSSSTSAASSNDSLLLAQGALLGHSTPVTAVAVSSGLSIIVSGSEDGQVLLHTLSDGSFVRSVHTPLHSPISNILIGKLTGNIVVHSAACAYTGSLSINGAMLASTSELEDVSALQIAYLEGFGAEVLLVGMSNGELHFLQLSSLKPLRKPVDIGGVPSAIRSIEVSPDQMAIFVGSEDGQISVLRALVPEP